VQGITRIGTDVDDVRLVDMAISGESRAFDALVERFQRAVHAVAFAVVADRETALDVLQETFIAAYRQLHTLNDGSRFGPWVCGIARNQAKRLRRVSNRHTSRELPLPEMEVAPNEPQADALAERISDALAALTEMQADAVTLFYMEGYSIVECAAILEVPQGTIKRRLHDARQRLKKEMAEMVKDHLKEFALPEDFRVVIDKPSRLPNNRPTLCWFKDRWVLIWQDGTWWGPELWRCDGFEYWLSESKDARTWSEPRRLEIPIAHREDAHAYHLTHSCIHKGRVYLSTYMHNSGTDLYSSDDLVNWVAHPRLRLWAAGRGDIFSAGENLIVTHPAWVAARSCVGDRVDLLKSADGGNYWQWMTPAAWPMAILTDTAGTTVGDRIYIAWRECGETEFRGWSDPGVQGTLEVHISWSDDDGASWSEPVNVEPAALHNKLYSYRLQLVAAGKDLILCQEAGNADEWRKCEIWLTFSSDGGKTWSEKAVYRDGSLRDPAIAAAGDGTFILAGSSYSDDGSRTWVIHSRTEF